MANKMARMVWAVLTKEKLIAQRCCSNPPKWLADDACRTTGLEIAPAIPTSANHLLRLTDLNFTSSCQVC